MKVRGSALKPLFVLAALLLLAGCSTASKPAATPTPKGFDVPAKVTLTKTGTTIAQGKPATVVYRVSDNARSAIDVTLGKVTKGKIKDFKFFSLDDKSSKATPYYVQAVVKNEGPAGIGGSAVPLYAHDSSNSITPPNEIVGDFKKCQPRTLPKSMLPGADVKVCLVFLVPEGTTLVSIDLQTTDMDKPISWKP